MSSPLSSRAGFLHKVVTPCSNNSSANYWPVVQRTVQAETPSSCQEVAITTEIGVTELGGITMSLSPSGEAPVPLMREEVCGGRGDSREQRWPPAPGPLELGTRQLTGRVEQALQKICWMLIS